MTEYYRDIKAWAHLGLYISHKLRAAVEYHKYVKTNNTDHHQEAVATLENAVAEWKRLVEVTTPIYKPMPLMHFTFRRENDNFHWSIVEKEVVEELNWLKI